MSVYGVHWSGSIEPHTSNLFKGGEISYGGRNVGLSLFISSTIVDVDYSGQDGPIRFDRQNMGGSIIFYPLNSLRFRPSIGLLLVMDNVSVKNYSNFSSGGEVVAINDGLKLGVDVTMDFIIVKDFYVFSKFRGISTDFDWELSGQQGNSQIPTIQAILGFKVLL